MATIKTPLQFLPRLSETLGRQIWIKRDDLNGDILTAGNKRRKLAYLLADAKQKGADTVLTTGGPNSNHARATAAMSIQMGLTPILVLAGREPDARRGNYLLNSLMGVEMKFSGARTQEEMESALRDYADQVAQAGKRPYVIGVGGSNGLGSLGYVDAYSEMKRQAAEAGVHFEWIFAAAGSGGTLAGLIYGRDLAGDQTEIVGISPWLKETEIRMRIDQCLAELDVLAEQRRTAERSGPAYRVSDAYLGKGYGVPTDTGMEALRLLAQSEAILLDHVYTAKTMAGCLDFIRSGIISPGANVLFWHTGGAPGLFVLE
ncbi:pyridoxal-phosphate dependent enzyme [Brevibacillus humidisoli]|uniref:1-aminocyclopropane-1-carboxylate deaminase/D-cysteine desulfhydrase n=1 Tax=Brevibacillus humidisoli TaxID=2895522 RepID=UPI001E5F6E2D|nr:pyridoxal-phosphate dependent enzyme [Brevibacillus humidisoli]UFJ40234.1 pyridoxal-phosphate dependent enzyme [Brevibacillus humidisoli]